MSTGPKKEENAKPPIPAWAWLFAIACAIIPVLTLGGAIPGAIGFGGAAGCIAVARDRAMAVGSKVAVCAVITAACWALVIVLLGGPAMFVQR